MRWLECDYEIPHPGPDWVFVWTQEKTAIGDINSHILHSFAQTCNAHAHTRTTQGYLLVHTLATHYIRTYTRVHACSSHPVPRFPCALVHTQCPSKSRQRSSHTHMQLCTEKIQRILCCETYTCGVGSVWWRGKPAGVAPPCEGVAWTLQRERRAVRGTDSW